MEPFFDQQVVASQQTVGRDVAALTINTTTTTTMTLISCLPIWDSKNAKFSDCALPYISGIPLILLGVILVLTVLARLVNPWRPQWTRRFIIEEEIETLELRPGHDRASYLHISLLILLAFFSLVCSISQLVLEPRDLAPVLVLLSWSIVLLTIGVTRPRTAPAYLLVFYLSAFCVELLSVLNIGVPSGIRDGTYYVVLSSTFASIIIILFMRQRDPALSITGISRVSDTPSSVTRSPEDNLRLGQFLSISWIMPLIRAGRHKTLNEEDVWLLGYEFQHARLFEKFSELKGTVLGRLLKANGIDVCILTLSASVETVCDYLTPVVLQQVLAAMEDPSRPKRVALTYALIILILRIITAQAEVFNTWFGRRCYERSRGEMILMVYEKALSRKNVIGVDPELQKASQIGNNGKPANGYGTTTRSRWTSWCTFRFFSASKGQPSKDFENSKSPASMGKILNICRGDVYDVAQRFWEIENIIENCLGLILSIALVWILLGPSCFIGVLVIIIGQVLNVVFTRIQLKIIKRGRGATDGRLQVTSQFIEAIRHLRWYGWHSRWIKQIHDAREHELRLRVQRMIWSTLINLVNVSTAGLFPVAALYGYTVLGGHTLSIDIIFPALSLFGRLSSSLREIPQIIQQLADAYIAMSRIEDFMNEPDRGETNVDATAGNGVIQLVDCDFSWPDQSEPVLRRLNLSFDEGFHIIYGTVGAGKTALLQGILGELDKFAGTSQMPDEMIGYCSQTPWLQSMTIRDNILFSSPYDEWRYKNVLDACELLPDLAEFEQGDLSAIGENGIGLSGGQKARVALARAIYSQARILLLDDPISALDFTTTERIVAKCFNGPLIKGRIVILVTHRVDLVRHLANQFIRIENGQAIASSNEGHIIDSDADTTPNGHEAKLDQNAEAKGIKQKDEDAKLNKFEEDEHRAEFGVAGRVYWNYVKAGKLHWWALTVVSLAVWRLSGVGQTWFLKAWGEAYQQMSSSHVVYDRLDTSLSYNPLATLATASIDDPFQDLPSPRVDVKPWLLVYLGITTWISLASWLSQICLVVLSYVSSKTLFLKAMTAFSTANFRFYDITPVGRLMNRLTSDISAIDAGVAPQIYNIVFQAITWTSALVVIGSVTPAFLVFSICFVALSVWIFLMFLPTSQSLRRLETVSLSPLFANFGELLHGLTTVRAFHAQHRFLDRIIGVVDKFQGMDHFYWSLQNWLAFRLQNMSAIATFILTALALYTNVSPGLTAFVLTAAGNFIRSTHVLCRRYGALQMSFVSVERVDELLQLEEEPSGPVAPPASWPTYGSDIVLEHVTVRYAPHLDPALNDISMRIPGGSTTAILGRTGSGKSTLAVTLLNVTRPETGRIEIDKLDIKDIQNQALRERITFVAQDPVLFPGSIKHNLDPMDNHEDSECEAVLQRVCGRHGWTLDTNIEAGGRNLSQGQRQLIGLTRAILRRSSIVILDEATASIDYESSMEIQKILREELQQATVVTIAHRLQAVRDADYAVFLDKGRVVRQGPAKEMLALEQNMLEGTFEQGHESRQEL